MSLLYAIISGIVQGITEFLPVSSFGHSGFLRNLFGVPADFATLFSVFLHMGSLAAIVFVMKKEIRSIIRETIRLIRDLLVNALIYFKNRRSEKKMGYINLITRKTRKFTAMILVASIPTFILGFAGRNLVALWDTSSVWPAIGFLMTGVVLLVVFLSKAGGKKGIAEASFDQAMWIGIVQGLSIFPGISRYGLTLSCGLFYGYSRKYALRYSLLLSVPAILGSFLYELTAFTSPEITFQIILCCIVGMILAAITGIFCIRIMIKLVNRLPFVAFSVYCFIVGIITLVYNFQ